MIYCIELKRSSADWGALKSDRMSRKTQVFELELSTAPPESGTGTPVQEPKDPGANVISSQFH